MYIPDIRVYSIRLRNLRGYLAEQKLTRYRRGFLRYVFQEGSGANVAPELISHEVPGRAVIGNILF